MIETTRRHLFIAGFMGTGKTSIGQVVAGKLAWGQIDLDELIVSMTHRSIDSIFQSEGEPAFRDYESRALRLAVIAPHSVISLGGGTPSRQANANIIRATGRCCLLTARIDVIWKRVRRQPVRRPLIDALSRDSGSIEPSFESFRISVEELIRRRQLYYDRVADFVVDTSEIEIGAIADSIINRYNALSGKRGHS